MVRHLIPTLALLVSVLVSAAGADSPLTVSLFVGNEQNEPVSHAVIAVIVHDRVFVKLETDIKGCTQLVVAHPGLYDVTVSKPGFLAVHTTLTIDQTTAPAGIDIILPAAALSHQEVEVQDAAPNPVAATEDNRATLIATQVAETPDRPATVKDSLPLVPGVARASDGSVKIAGLAENHSALLVNSVDVTDPATGEFGLTVPIDSVESVSVAEMPYLAQYGRFIAGVVAAETRHGEDKWKFDLNDPLPEFRIRSGHLAGLRAATPRLNLSGPVIPGRLYLLEGIEYLLDKHAVRTLPFPDNQTTTKAFNSFTQLDAVVSPKQMLTFTFHFAPHSLSHAGLDYFNPEPVTPEVHHHESTAAIADRWSVDGGLLQSTLAITHVSSSVEPQGMSAMILTPAGNQGSYFSQQERTASRLEWIENWQPHTLHLAGNHSVQLGLVLARSHIEGQFQARPVQIEDAAGNLVSRIDYSRGTPFSISDVEPAYYAQDHWVLNPHFAVDGGIRLEQQTITHTFRVAPRGGFVWAMDHRQRTILRGGSGVFYDYVPLNTYAFRHYPAETETDYRPSGGAIAPPMQFVNQIGEASLGLSLVHRGSGTGSFAPYSVAWHLELEHTVTNWLMFRITHLESSAHDLLTLEPETAPARSSMMLGSFGFAQVRQWEVTSRIGSRKTRQFYFSYTRQQAHGTVNAAGDYLGGLPFPVIRSSLVASLPGELPNRFLLWGVYNLPYRFRMIPKVEYRNGFPYQPVDVTQQYFTATAGAQTRFPRYFSWDLRAAKDIQLTPRYGIRLSATIANVTNHFNPLEVHANVADPHYGTFFGTYPRKLSLDFDFLF